MDTQLIPPGFSQIDSSVDGITVYAPVPVTDSAAITAEYKCPNCGAPTQYEIAAGGIACQYCGYTAPIGGEHIGKSAGEYEFTLDALKQAQRPWVTDFKDLHCDSCGADLLASAASMTATCPFCSSNKVNIRKAPDDQLRPNSLIPFRVESKMIREKAIRWLGQGWFHPPGLTGGSFVDRFTGIYLPYWTFDATIQAQWKAQVGFERQEQYYDAGSKQWQTRTVIDWVWKTGQILLEKDDLLMSGSTHVSPLILKRLLPYQLEDLVTFSGDYLAGWQTHIYDISLSDAWQSARNKMREDAKQACHKSIPSPHVRNFSMTAEFSNEVWRHILLPTYVASYTFENKTYQVLANGQTGVVAGQKPVVWWKVWLVISILIAPGVALGLLGLFTLVLGGLGFIPLLAGIVLFAVGTLISVFIFRSATQSEAS